MQTLLHPRASAPPLNGAPGVRLWRPFPRAQVDVMCEHTVALEVPSHAHEEFEISLAVTAHVVRDGRRDMALAAAGTLVLVNPGELHGARARDGQPWSALALLAGASAMRHVWERTGRHVVAGPYFPRRTVADPGLAAAFIALWDDLQYAGGTVAIADRVRHFLADVVARHATPLPEDDPDAPRPAAALRQARRYLVENLDSQVELDELSGVTGVSKYHLLRLFQREVGLSPREYQMQLRLARARSLIAAGVPLSRVAYDAGFSDQSHLIKRFKRSCGLTPSAFARHVVAPGVCAAATASPSVAAAA